MKKSIIIIIAIVWGLVGCENSTKESLNNQTTITSAATNDALNTTEQTTLNNQDKSSANNEVSSSTKSNNLNQKSQKQEYKAKLDKIDLDFKEFSSADATTHDMYQEVCKEQKQWDDVLNEIYGILKVQLSASDMKKLQSEEIQWIKDRDNKAKNDAAEMAGGTMEKVLFVGSLAKSTKERCYVLVDKYMK